MYKPPANAVGYNTRRKRCNKIAQGHLKVTSLYATNLKLVSMMINYTQVNIYI